MQINHVISGEIVPFLFLTKLDLNYLVEEKNEVDGKTHKQSQETQVVEVTSQVVL